MMSQAQVVPTRRTRRAFLFTTVFFTAIFPVTYPAPFGSPYSFSRMVLAAGSVGALVLISARYKFPMPPWPGSALVGLAALSLAWAQDFSRGVTTTAILCLLTLAAVISVELLGLSRFLAAFSLAAVGPLILGLGAFITQDAASEAYLVSAAPANINEVARLAVVAGLATLAAPLTARRRSFLLPVALAEFALAFASGSNQARLSLAISGAALLLLGTWKRVPRLRPAFPLFALTGFVAVVWALLANWFTITVQLGEDPSLNLRTGLWGYLFQVVSNDPILGSGWGCAFGPNTDLIINMPASIGFVPLQAHNTYLQLALELGVLGALLLPAFLATVLINTYKSRAVLGRAAALGCVFVVVNLAVWSFSADIISGRDAHLWVLLVGVSIGTRPAARLSRRKTSADDPELAVTAA